MSVTKGNPWILNGKERPMESVDSLKQLRVYCCQPTSIHMFDVLIDWHSKWEWNWKERSSQDWSSCKWQEAKSPQSQLSFNSREEEKETVETTDYICIILCPVKIYTYSMAANQAEEELCDCLAKIGWSEHQCNEIIGLAKALRALTALYENCWKMSCMSVPLSLGLFAGWRALSGAGSKITHFIARLLMKARTGTFRLARSPLIIWTWKTEGRMTVPGSSPLASLGMVIGYNGSWKAYGLTFFRIWWVLSASVHKTCQSFGSWLPLNGMIYTKDKWRVFGIIKQAVTGIQNCWDWTTWSRASTAPRTGEAQQLCLELSLTVLARSRRALCIPIILSSNCTTWKNAYSLSLCM